MNTRSLAIGLVALMSIGVAACHHDRDRTVVVNPPASTAAPGTTVVTPPAGTTRVCPAGAVTC